MAAHLRPLPRCGTCDRPATQAPGSAVTNRMSKKDAGRELDGRTWDEYPLPRPAGVGWVR